MFNLYGTKFQTEEFKSLFLDTWSYLRDAVDCTACQRRSPGLLRKCGIDRHIPQGLVCIDIGPMFPILREFLYLTAVIDCTAAVLSVGK